MSRVQGTRRESHERTATREGKKVKRKVGSIARVSCIFKVLYIHIYSAASKRECPDLERAVSRNGYGALERDRGEPDRREMDIAGFQTGWC